MQIFFKKNWDSSKERYIKWWNQEGVIISCWKGYSKFSAEDIFKTKLLSWRDFWSDPEYSARYNEYVLSNLDYPLDILPIAKPDLGPGSLCLFLGSDIKDFSEKTIWYDPADFDIFAKPFEFEPECKWWQIQQKIIRKNLEYSKGRYMVGFPDLIENLDIMASLLGTENLLFALTEKPQKIKEKIFEINQIYFEVYNRIYEMIKDEKGCACFGAFNLWAPGKVAKVQCDVSVLISPSMFKDIVIPALDEQCRWLDYSMYHIDGSAELRHLDNLLKIENLKAFEWTPEPTVPSGGSAQWFDLYKRILAAGKSLQLIHIKPQEVETIFENLGTNGLYLAVDCDTPAEFEQIEKIHESISEVSN
ncbi:MAG: hypothetical protein A2Y10_12890 [Planctomycetes bacterium GWF2_41_51]|nr:MAG: hypothetical protein A2Y10_12890 [Planctomycetes bacterium GWF2_41_51]HBG28231.1 hypothetical protein [Phycisphaerales bacterium]